jgi:hypothetical protein
LVVQGSEKDKMVDAFIEDREYIKSLTYNKKSVDKTVKILYNVNKLDSEGASEVSQYKDKNQTEYVVTYSFKNENPTQDEIQALREEVVRILLPNL